MYSSAQDKAWPMSFWPHDLILTPGNLCDMTVEGKPVSLSFGSKSSTCKMAQRAIQILVISFVFFCDGQLSIWTSSHCIHRPILCLFLSIFFNHRHFRLTLHSTTKKSIHCNVSVNYMCTFQVSRVFDISCTDLYISDLLLPDQLPSLKCEIDLWTYIRANIYCQLAWN